MADFDNLSAINENFDTIKTLLNSIRAQGILNTSDVDKLLTGIYSKLEKINTEEDIDLIKIFLSELKQNLDERHGVLVSKFGAIESLFTNLLKNSSEMPKSAELKELFDIVATNLSVFSREVVSQKEALTDITLRLDALRSDDSQKKDIIKNIGLLRPELERLNNGFDSIVLNLNDNFKNVIKSVTALDNTEQFTKFSNAITGMDMSFNTILSALQMLDKKAENVDDFIKSLATKEDFAVARQKLFELTAQGNELTAIVTDLSERYVRIDNLSEKIDASVNIVAGLKSFLEESGNSNARILLDEIAKLEHQLENITNDTKFDDFKVSLESVLQNIGDNIEVINKDNSGFYDELKKISSFVNTLDIGSGFQTVLSNLLKSESEIKLHIDDSVKKSFDLQEANISRVLKDISANAEMLGSKLNQTQSSLAVLCEKNFGSVFTSIADLKNVVAQIDENSVSANNAIFSSITDRLTVFENSLKVSLDAQEQTVSLSSAQLAEQVENIKNLSNVLDYKMDSSVVEVANIKREFASLKTAIDEVLALDFVTAVKDLRVDLYASKQELANIVETTNTDLSNNFTNDIYGKYELLISKLDNVEDELKKTQTASLNNIKVLLENISASIVDVISYVSETKTSAGVDLDTKVAEISNALKENNLNYVENVRDVVDVIRIQVENNLKNIEESAQANFEAVKQSISDSSENIKQEIKYSYSKLLELQDSYKELKELINVNSVTDANKFDNVISAADEVKTEFEIKLANLKNTLLEKISEFKQDFTCENADKVSELKFSVENLNNKNLEVVTNLVEEIRTQLANATTENANARTASLAKVFDNFVSIKEIITNLNSKSAAEMSDKIEFLINDFASVKEILNKVDETIDEDLTRQLSIIESNFESLVSQISILFEKADRDMSARITGEFEQVSSRMHQTILESLEAYKAKVETTLESLQDKVSRQSSVLQDKITEINEMMKVAWEEQAERNYNQISDFANSLKAMMDENIKVSASDYEALKIQMSEFAKNVESENEILTIDLKAQIDDITKYLDSVLDVQSQEQSAKFEELIMQLNLVSDGIVAKTQDLKTTLETQSKQLNKYEQEISVLQQMSADNNKKADDVEGLVKEHLELAKTANLEIAELNLISTDLTERVDNVNAQVATQIDLAKNSNAGIAILTQWGKEHSAKTSTDLSTLNAIMNKNINKVDSLETLLNEHQGIIVDNINGTNSTLQNVQEQVSSITENSETIKSDLSALGFLASESGEKLENIENYLKEQLDKQSSKSDAIFNSALTIEETSAKALEVTESLASGISGLSQDLSTNTEQIKGLETSLTDKVISLKALTAEISAGELQALDVHVNNLSEQIESGKQSLKLYNDLLSELLKTELATLTSNVEKETDIIVAELIEQFDILKQSKSDDIIELTNKFDEIISLQIYNNIEDLKSYLDIKTDNSVLTCKLDNLKNEMVDSISDVLTLMNKLVDSEAFASTISDFRTTSEVLLTSTVEKLNSKLETFIHENTSALSGSIGDSIDSILNQLAENKNAFSEKLALLDKKFVETVIDKYEELKLISNNYNESFAEIKASVSSIMTEFSELKFDIGSHIEALITTLNETNCQTNTEIKKLSDCFEDLKNQISSKSFDEAFQASINKQINGLESLVIEQMNYIEDINDLCSNSLPDLSEMNALVKYSVMESLKSINEKLGQDGSASSIEESINQVKSEIVTQLINIFNQISFVAEQEEILDFIQEKHDELITVLSHIVTTSEDVSAVRENVTQIDSKIETLKDDIYQINDKINSIISSEGDIDYIYSLQDLESDIANLRLVLKEIQSNNNSDEFSNLLTSTNEIYALVEAIKTELPNRTDFESMAEDIVSISTRTNKLILASDESYKALQDNLQEFKLVVNDLDERTKNFAEDSGLNRIDNKLNSINSMMQSGAKTNQVFNQVFEYLAEWVDNASVQINNISDRVETLDEITQIKTMIEDLKSSASDNTESLELVEALGAVFDKQTKRITSLETKLDKIIVETTINNRNNELNLTPIEDTLNKFLVAMDEKLLQQQTKIDILESKLGEVLDLVDGNDTAQLTKKVGGMDRQIAKLNKSIEKIASHVVEK